MNRISFLNRGYAFKGLLAVKFAVTQNQVGGPRGTHYTGCKKDFITKKFLYV